jgi:uncharacterized lipoprotein YmbA
MESLEKWNGGILEERDSGMVTECASCVPSRHHSVFHRSIIPFFHYSGLRASSDECRDGMPNGEIMELCKTASTNRFNALAAVCIFIVAVGCGSSPPARLYTLSAVGGPATTPMNVSVAVGPVAVPVVVDRPQFVITTGANQVALDEFNQWASPLQNNISRVVAENLIGMLGTPRVTLFSQTLGGDVMYRAGIDVQRFESMPGEAAILDAFWTVRRSRDGASQMGRTTVREAAAEAGYAALAAAHSRAIARLSQDIANAVRLLDRSGQKE